MAESDGEAKDDIKWENFPLEVYADFAHSLLHFSSKTVNSNAPPGGIRLSGEEKLDLPYVSVRTLLGKIGFGLDYPANAGKTAKLAKQIRLARNGEAPCSEAERTAILAAVDRASAGRFELHTDQVSPRLRQLLLPKDDSYVAVTPLSAAGLLAKVNEKVAGHNEAAKADYQKEGHKTSRVRIRTGHVGVGGANPHNVGSLVRELHSPLLFEAPPESRGVRKALAIHHSGIPLAPPKSVMEEYFQWRQAQAAKNNGRVGTGLDEREAEAGFLHRITHALLAKAAEARQILDDWRAVLPFEAGEVQLLSDKIAAPIRGAICPECRDREWPRQFALLVARAIAAYRFGKDEVQLPFSDQDIAWVRGQVEGVLR